MKKIVCDVYKSTCKHGYFLYVDKQKGLSDVPAELLAMLVDTTLAMTLLLTPEKKLAQVSAEAVMEQITDKGFYLQISQDGDEYMTAINRHNDKLAGI